MAEEGVRIVVGVDGSADARAAAEWAAREAEAHHGQLLIVHTWSGPALAGGPEMGALLRDDALEQSAEELLDDEVRHLRGLAFGLELETRLEYGSPTAALLDLAADAAMIVVGSRGMGRVAGLLLGSVSQAIVTRAPCPIVVVPPNAGRPS